MKKRIAALGIFLASVLATTQPVHADHYWGNVCADGQEVRVMGFAAWRVTVIYRLVTWDGNEYYRDSYFEHNSDEGWGFYFYSEVRDVQTWERISDIQISAPNGLHHAWYECFDEDGDSAVYGPIYRPDENY